MFKYVLPVLVLAAAATPASAATAYLSRSGSGTDCSLVTPCTSMSTALTHAGLRGEVICLDKGNYGTATFQFSVTVSCGDGLWESPEFAMFITPTQGSDVVIEGLVMDGASNGTFPIIMNGQGTLHLRRVRIGNYPGTLVNFNPNGPATLHISDSVFYGSGGSGVLIKPQSGGFANVHMRNVRFEHNLHGLFVDGTDGTVNVNMAESAAVDNRQNGIGAFTPNSASVTVSVNTSQITGNLTNGIGALGANAAVKIGNSQITGNNNGLATASSGQILTLGGNHLHSNLSDGTFTGGIATK